MTLVVLPDRSWADRVGPLDGVEVITWDLTGPAPERAAEVEVLVPPYPTPVDRLGRLAELPNLRLVQVLMAGYDGVAAHLPAGATLCNAAGVHDAATAELAVALILASLREIPDFVRAQSVGRWGREDEMYDGLADRSVLIVGYGSIGRAIAARLAAFEVRLGAVASRARAGDELIPHVHGMAELPTLLPGQDVVVLIVPLTEATERMVDDAFLSSMRDGALLVNVARGRVVDTDALLDHARRGRIRAALDVTDPEPLPDDHPLYAAPGVLISPHVGGRTQAFYPRAARLLRSQLSAYAASRPLSNIVRSEGARA